MGEEEVLTTDCTDDTDFLGVEDDAYSQCTHRNRGSLTVIGEPRSGWAAKPMILPSHRPYGTFRNRL